MSQHQYDPAKVTIHPGVKFGKDVVIHDFCVIGMPPQGAKPGEAELIIGDGSVIRPFSTLYGGSQIGARFQCGQGVTIREDNLIGDDCSLGTGSVLEIGNRLADWVRIHTYTSMGHVTIEERALIGPYIVFLDDPHPQCPRYKECVGGATVKRYARIGAGCVVNPGVIIGENCLVGSGTLVNKDVPPNVIFTGQKDGSLKRIEELRCFKDFYSRAYEWDPPELFDPSISPKPKA